jgi:hypothetical protein
VEIAMKREPPAKERKEANSLLSEKLSPKAYTRMETAEGNGKNAMATAKKIKSGAVTPKQYAYRKK